MVNINSKALLDKMQDLEYEKFIINKQGTHGLLAKQARIQKCFKSIYATISTRDNSVFQINNHDGSLSINISNVEDENDHVSAFIITLHETCETYQLDKIINRDKPILQNIKRFEIKEETNE
jgi:hypothetical protein